MKFITNLKKLKANKTNHASTTAKASNQTNTPKSTENNLTLVVDYFLPKKTLKGKYFVKEPQHSTFSREREVKLI